MEYRDRSSCRFTNHLASQQIATLSATILDSESFSRFTQKICIAQNLSDQLRHFVLTQIKTMPRSILMLGDQPVDSPPQWPSKQCRLKLAVVNITQPVQQHAREGVQHWIEKGPICDHGGQRPPPFAISGGDRVTTPVGTPRERVCAAHFFRRWRGC
jgi:hypothetical protein